MKIEERARAQIKPAAKVLLKKLSRALLVTLFPWVPALADPLAPSLMELNEQKPGEVTVLWKTPLKLPRSNPQPLKPLISKDCRRIAGSADKPVTMDKNSLIYRWQLDCQHSLTGKKFGVSNIATQSANVLLRIVLSDGQLISRILTPENHTLVVPQRQSGMQVFWQYLRYGTEHLATGFDHILFIITLVMLVGINRSLVLIVTLFTLGHSITLCLASLGYLGFPSVLAEILIALSIVVTAAAGLNQEKQAFIQRKPWFVACGFGLLHGLGFAGALLEIGLPPQEIPVALLAFNIGVEIGQLILIGLLMPLTLFWNKLPGFNLSSNTTVGILQYLNGYAPTFVSYVIGTTAGFWFWQRLVQASGF